MAETRTFGNSSCNFDGNTAFIDLYCGEHAKPRYTIDAEENAHELLKSMITFKQFKLYKNKNYVEVKGTYGRKYKVYKSQMIRVSQKIKNRKRKVYSLCIEPRDIADICPTDVVIAKIKLIKADEKHLHSISNKFSESELTYSNGCWNREEPQEFRGGDFRFPLRIY